MILGTPGIPRPGFQVFLSLKTAGAVEKRSECPGFYMFEIYKKPKHSGGYFRRRGDSADPSVGASFTILIPHYLVYEKKNWSKKTCVSCMTPCLSGMTKKMPELQQCVRAFFTVRFLKQVSLKLLPLVRDWSAQNFARGVCRQLQPARGPRRNTTPGLIRILTRIQAPTRAPSLWGARDRQGQSRGSAHTKNHPGGRKANLDQEDPHRPAHRPSRLNHTLFSSLTCLYFARISHT